ncbi:MAG: sigma-70 family RNA polymerase sigma factor [Planctomycetota bacterium]
MACRPDLDQRFAHFCRTGEPAALGEVFDGTARELLHVAVWLAGNRVDAEDLLQRTFLCAIETRARFGAGAAVVPWLMGILAIEARHLRRERDRRLAAAPPPPAHDPAAAVAAQELDAAVHAIGEELGAPYREVLRLHLQEGMNAKEIAARLQRPGGTVRTQLVRALELLRKKLPSGFVAGFVPLVLPEELVLATVRSAVMRTAELTVPVAAAAATTWTLTGSLTMGKKFAALAAVVLLLVAGAAVLTRQGDVDRPGSATPVAARSEVDARVRDEGAPTRVMPRTEVATPSVAPASPGSTTGALLVQVFWQKDETPAAAVGVAVWPLLGSAARQELLCVSDAAGQCRFEALPPGDYTVESASGITRTASIAAGATIELRLPADHWATARGVVIDEFERPVAGADIWLSEELNWFRGYVVAQSDAAGRFSVPTGNHEYIGARKAGYIASYWRGFHARSGDPPQVRRDFEFTLQLRGAAGAVRGRVVDAERRPVAGARVFVGPQSATQAPGMRGLNDEYEPRGVTLVTDDDGGFRSQDVPPGPTELLAWACGHGPARGGVLVQVGAEAVAELQLPAAASLQGVVRDGAGAPVADAALQIGGVRDFLGASTRSGADGSYRFADLGAGEVRVEVTKTGSPSPDLGGGAGAELKVEGSVVLAAGATTTWDPVLLGTRIVRGVVLDPSGQPMTRVYVGLEPWMGGAGGGRADCQVDAAGRFAFTDVARDGTQILNVRDGRADLRKVAVPPGQDEVVVRLTAEDLPTASLRLRPVDAAGNACPGEVMLQRLGENFSLGMQRDPATGVVSAGAMRPGSYELYVVTDQMVLPLPPQRLHEHEAKDLGDVVVPTPTRLHLFVRTAADAPARSGWISLVDAGGQSCVINPPELRDGELEVTAPPGTWTLIVNGAAATVATAVVLRPGSTTECRVTMPVCREVPLLIVPDAAVFAFGMMRVLVHGADGALRYCGNVITRRDGSLGSTFHLAPGEYSLTVIGGGDSRGSASFAVPAAGAVGPLQVALRAGR